MPTRLAYSLIAASILLCAGCASSDTTQKPLFELEIWDCRGDKPRRINEYEASSNDLCRPNFGRPIIPQASSLPVDKKSEE